MSTTATLKDQTREWTARNPLRKWRQRQDPGLSMMDAAGLFGVAMSSIQAWEQGAHYPSDDGLDTLAAGMKVKRVTLDRSWREWYASRPSAAA